MLSPPPSSLHPSRIHLSLVIIYWMDVYSILRGGLTRRGHSLGPPDAGALIPFFTSLTSPVPLFEDSSPCSAPVSGVVPS